MIDMTCFNTGIEQVTFTKKLPALPFKKKGSGWLCEELHHEMYDLRRDQFLFEHSNDLDASVGPHI